MKKPAPPQSVHPATDDPEKRFQETDNVDEENPGFAARKRLVALKAIKRSQSDPREQTNGEENGDEKSGSQEQDPSKA